MNFAGVFQNQIVLFPRQSIAYSKINFYLLKASVCRSIISFEAVFVWDSSFILLHLACSSKKNKKTGKLLRFQ